MSNSSAADTLEPDRTLKTGDWLQTVSGTWAKLTRIYDPETIECVYAPNGSLDAYRRDFVFRDGWWRFRYPDPDGGYLPTGQRRPMAEKLKEGPPSRIEAQGGSYRLVYLGENVWCCSSQFKIR